MVFNVEIDELQILKHGVDFQTYFQNVLLMQTQQLQIQMVILRSYSSILIQNNTRFSNFPPPYFHYYYLSSSTSFFDFISLFPFSSETWSSNSSWYSFSLFKCVIQQLTSYFFHHPNHLFLSLSLVSLLPDMENILHYTNSVLQVKQGSLLLSKGVR